MGFGAVFGGGFRPVFDRGGAARNGLLNALIAYWPLNEAAGAHNALDLHSNALTLTQVDSPGAATGVLGYARTFDGENDYFTADDNALFEIGTGSMSLAIWVYRQSNVSVSLRIVSHGAQDNFTAGYSVFGSDTYCRLIICNGTSRLQADSPAITVNVWYHIVGVVNRTTNFITVYCNGFAGTPTDISAFAENNINSNRTFRIGSSDPGTLRFVGYLSDCVLWQRALSQAEIQALYNNGAGLRYTSFTT
jgi:hypothetical protein